MEPSKYDEIVSKMKNYLNSTVYSENVYDPSIAYTSSRTKSLCGTIYKIVVNNKDPVLAKYLYMHEAGHIIFGHAKNMDEREDRFLIAKIAVAYNKVSKYFDSYEEFLHIFRTLVFNVVMDFEVNSRLFSNAEWACMNKLVQKLLRNKGVHGLWPEDFGFEKNLTWNTYLNLILLNPENFIKKIRELINQKLQQEANANLNGKFTIEEIRELRKLSEEHNSSTFQENKNKYIGNSRGSAISDPIEIVFKSYNNLNDLLHQIVRILHIKTMKLGQRDQLYNYNRRKYSSNILIPKDKKTPIVATGKLYILMDVSGSVDPDNIHNFAYTFQQVKENFRQTRFITWDTRLIAEWDIDEPVIDKYGASTNIASGINYIAQKYKPKSKDTIFVISDFCDNLNNWKTALQNINCKKYAINWNKTPPLMNPGFKVIFNYSE